jgi:cytochrome c-type biogenesis protein CcmH/NrfG
MSVSQSAQMWKNMSEQWPETWLPKLALIETIREQGTESESLLTPPEMIEILENILEQQPERVEERILLTRIYRSEGQNNNALREYKRILRESAPSDDFLAEAAEFYDKLGLSWDANNARERITTNTTN